MKKWSLLVLVLVFIAPRMKSAEWYVDNAATGTRNGTSWANAWTNLNSVTGTSSGDTVYISGGTVSKTYRDPFWTPPNGITFRIGQEAGHNGRAIFDSQGVNNAWIYGAIKNVTIDGLYNGQKRFVVTNAAGPNHWSIWCDGASDMTVRGVEAWEAMRWNPGTNIHVSQCFVRPFPPTNGTPSYAMLTVWRQKASEAMAFTNNSVKQCVFELPRSAVTPAWGADGLKSGRCIDYQSNITYTVTGMENVEWQHSDGWQIVATAGEGSWCRIRDSYFTNFANYGIYWEMTGAVSNVHVFNNVVLHTTSSTADEPSVGIVVACQGASGVTYSNIVIANNTVIDNYGRAALAIADASAANTYQNCIVANNLTYNSGVAGGEPSIRVGNSSGTNGLAIYGNKMISGPLGTNTIETAQLASAGGDNNLVMVSYSELSASNNPRLQASDTAAKDAGFDLSTYFSTDADGNTRSGSWDVGAFEFVEATPPTISTNNAGSGRVAGFRGLRMEILPLPVSHNHPASPLLFEDFEASGYTTAGWASYLTGTGNSINPDNTTNVLSGSQSFALVGISDDPSYATNSFTASSEVFGYLEFKCLKYPSEDGDAYRQILRLEKEDGTPLFNLMMFNTGVLYIQTGGTSDGATAFGALTLGQTYYIWFSWDKNNGSNSAATMSVSTTKVRPTSGDGFMSITGTTIADDATRLMIGYDNTSKEGNATFNGAPSWIYDYVILDDVEIQSYP